MNPAGPHSAPTLPECLDLVIAGLCQAMLDQCGIDRFIAPMCVALWSRLLRTSKRFEALFARWRAGRLKPARAAASRARPKRLAAPGEPERALPRGFAWLLKFVPPAAIYGAQLQHLLTTPEMAAFLADAPQAGRLLRPLCRALGVKPIPQMLRPPKPRPATPEAQDASPEQPARPPRSAETTANNAQPDIARQPDPGPPDFHADDFHADDFHADDFHADNSHAGDPRWARPVSLWCKPPRPPT